MSRYTRRDGDVILADRERLAELRVQGYTLAEIVRMFSSQGRNYSRAMAETDWEAIKESWTSARLPETIGVLQEELHANDVLLRHAWRMYRSAAEACAMVDYLNGPEAEIEGGAAGQSMTLRVRKQAFTEVRYWWGEIVKLRSERTRMLGLTAASININFDNREQNVVLNTGPDKIYIGFDPTRDWPAALPATTTADTIEGEYEDN